MKKFILFLFSSLLVSCTDHLENIDPLPEGAIELTGIQATIVSSASSMTRAEGDHDYLPEHISRFRFEAGDQVNFPMFRRKDNPIDRFNYKDVVFEYNASAAWVRDEGKGTLADGTSFDRIYWSDATSEHAFAGFSKPTGMSETNWTLSDGSYHGQIGGTASTIDYNPLETDVPDKINVEKDGNSVEVDVKKSSKMRAEDLLLASGDTLRAIASVAYVKFYHALSSIKVQVNIHDFYGSELDGYTIVKDMVLHDQPTKYKWNQNGVKAIPESTTHSENAPKKMLLWNYSPEGSGVAAAKVFTFYGITVPQTASYFEQNPNRELYLTFNVQRPDPMKTDLEKVKKGEATIAWAADKQYSAKITTPVYFYPGQCTVINMSLNHMNDELTIGAEYMEWQFESTPDEGNLRKNSTFLPSRTAGQTYEQYYSSHGKTADQNTTEDDATWLYYKKENGERVQINGKDVVLDVFGNDGSKAKPYKISSAIQLISFANEVNGGRKFTGQYIELDADLFLQPNTTDFTIDWEGIGNETTSFNGTLLGGGRKISRIKGSPLFYNLGPAAVIDNLVLADQINISGTGALANSNAGMVIGCVVEADVESSQANAGSLLGSNTGTVEACYHIGSMKGTTGVAGLVGHNSGTITGCYNAGSITASGSGKYGVTNNSGTVSKCFYNKTLAGNLSGEDGKTTLDMQREIFAAALNKGFIESSKYGYKYNPAMYPTLVPYIETVTPVISTGYYRVRNVGSTRYVHVTDNKGSISSSAEDLGAIVLKNELMYSDPASIIYIENVVGNEYNLHSQGTSVHEITGYNVIINKVDDHYRVGATSGFVDKYLGDINGAASTHVSDAPTKDYLLWDVIPVDETTYFGVTPTVTVGSDYYAPFYADFGFKVSSGMEVYYAELTAGSVTLKKIDSEIIPAKTPVIIKCKSDNAAENKLTLQHSVASAISGNALAGVLFNNEQRHNQVVYNSSTMRVLSVSGGKLVFKSSTESYLPANQSYLVVPAETTESELIVKFE